MEASFIFSVNRETEKPLLLRDHNQPEMITIIT